MEATLIPIREDPGWLIFLVILPVTGTRETECFRRVGVAEVREDLDFDWLEGTEKVEVEIV